MGHAKLAGIVLTLSLTAGQGVAISAANAAETVPSHPSPPQLPANFDWVGRYIVPDMNVDVPFTWVGRNGASQMTAGGDHDPIHFTNVIIHGHLYTLTYRWRGIPDNVLNVCHDAGAYSLATYNRWLRTSAFVGPEILGGSPPRAVNHFRAVIVEQPFGAQGGQESLLPPVGATPNLVPPASGTATTTTQPGLPFRFPVMEADFYVARSNSQRFVKVLHFGWQNYYDRNMDEWISVEHFSSRPGNVVLPTECSGTPSPSASGAPKTS
jgi:hypothetical protein